MWRCNNVGGLGEHVTCHMLLSIIIFNSRRYASAVYAVIVCLSIRWAWSGSHDSWFVIHRLEFDTLYPCTKFDDSSLNRSRDIIGAPKF